MSTTSSVSATTSTLGLDSSSSAASRVPVQTLGQDDFLKLLVTQMSSQDPLNPTKDTDFIAQMAQFSSLEENKAMQSSMAQILGEQQLLQANGLIGRAVGLQVDQNTVLHGVVSGVQIQAGTPQLVVNGQSYDLSQVLTVAPAETQTSQP
jgi:flagellar basal-body rod modification protein FlgD